MGRHRSSRIRRRLRQSETRSTVETDNEEESERSSEHELSDRPKSVTTPLKSRGRTVSGSSVKSSRRQSLKLRTSDESENENEHDSAATYTKYESPGTGNEKVEITNAIRKVEDFLKSARRGKNGDSGDSPEHKDETPRKERRRKSRRKWRENSRAPLDSNRTEDEDPYDEDIRSSEREPARSNKSRFNGKRKNRRKRRGSKGDSSTKTENEDKELPITEILRKAQENPKPRHEEPPPLVELTCDRIYVQGRNGFSAVKISNDRGYGIFGQPLPREKRPPLYPIRVAIVAQRIWNSTGFIHQGLLAGIALMHLILMQTFFRTSVDFFNDYAAVSEYYTNVFSYLVTMCVISAFDRFDLAHLDIEHYREIYFEHSKSILAIPLYLATLCLHQTSLLVDESVSLLGYPQNVTVRQNNSTSTIDEEDVAIWRDVTVAKDILAVLAWLFVALGPREDMLLSHLKSMEKYAEIPDNAA